MQITTTSEIGEEGRDKGRPETEKRGQKYLHSRKRKPTIQRFMAQPFSS